jgi:hypothetical protein
MVPIVIFLLKNFLRIFRDSSDIEVCFDNTAETNANLTLEINLTFPTWKAAFDHIKQWAHYQGFCS